MQETKSKFIFSRRQILFALLFSGLLPAGYLIARNLNNSDQKKAANWFIFAGYLGTFLVIVLAILIAEHAIIPSDGMGALGFFGYLRIILVFILLHALMAGLFWIYRDKLTRYYDREGSFYPNQKVAPYFLMGVAIIAYLLINGPFVFVFTVIFILPNLYLYHHIKHIFRKKNRRIVFTVLFVLIVAMFPIGEVLEHSSGNGLAEIFLWVGYYYLPFMLYLLLGYLIFDLFQLINRVAAFYSYYLLTKRKTRRQVFAVIVIISAGILFKGMHNFNHPRVNEYTVEIADRSPAPKQLTIALAADFHISNRTKISFMQRFVEKVNDFDPDLVLLAGDLIETMPNEAKTKYFQKAFNALETSFGIYAVEGNHELYGNNGKLHFFRNTKIQFLKDTVFNINDLVYLVGRKDRHNRNRKSLTELMSDTLKNLPRIVMDHQPYELTKTAAEDVDIQVSGHTHHGQLVPFHWITNAIYRLSWGYQKIQDTHFFVTCGAQGWGPPVKTSSPSEIMVIHVKFTG